MHTQTCNTLLRGLLLGSSLSAFPSVLSALDLVETFDGAALDAAVWETEGDKTASLTGGLLQINADGGNWARYSIKSEQRFFVPPVGQTSVFEWVLGPAAITNDTGQSFRYQIGIVSNNEPIANPEHYPNSTGGLWIDLDDIQAADTANVFGSTVTADDTKAPGSNGVQSGIAVAWNWQTENKALRLELTNDSFTWLDGTTILATDTLANVGIDSEFGNGFRVVAIGMNYDSGRGTTSFEEISVTNGEGPSTLLQSFSAAPQPVFAGQNYTLSWQVDPAASVSLDQGIGNVDAMTTSGTGSIQLLGADADIGNAIDYVLTVTKAGEPTATRQLTVNIVAPSELSFDDVSDDFATNSIDPAVWLEKGPIGNTITGGVITWDTQGAGNWAHGELDTVKVFPVPGPGQMTTVTWNLGKASVTADSANDAARANRPVLGLVSAFETNTYTLQHYQNTTGGIWMDIANMSSIDTSFVGGSFHAADDTKIADQNAPDIGGFSITDWDWTTDDREFSIVLTDTGFSWFDGTTELINANYADSGIDVGPGGEFSKGFRVMYASVKYEDGSGTMSLNSINVDNGASPASADPPVISDIVDNGDGTVTLTWSSVINSEYAIDTSTSLEDTDWSEFTNGITADDVTETFTINMSGPKLFFRVRKR